MEYGSKKQYNQLEIIHEVQWNVASHFKCMYNVGCIFTSHRQVKVLGKVLKSLYTDMMYIYMYTYMYINIDLCEMVIKTQLRVVFTITIDMHTTCYTCSMFVCLGYGWVFK